MCQSLFRPSSQNSGKNSRYCALGSKYYAILSETHTVLSK